MSRCQRFDLHRIPANLIAQHLQFIAGKEKITLEPAAAHAIARGAEGGLRDAESMLDQLVAFCGEKISESDVLSVFGFTSEQTVVDLTGRILRGETAGALDLLYQQSETGKDMMRLMSDLIVYLRDLLVFKAKPDALKEDVDPEVQKCVGRARGADRDRSAARIDRSICRGRRPDEMGAEQETAFRSRDHQSDPKSRARSTLDEVIENLARSSRWERLIGDAGASRVSADLPPRHGCATTTARVAETRRPNTSRASRAAAVDPAEVWKQASAKIPPQKAFLAKRRMTAAHVLGIDGRNFLLGFAPSENR